MAAVHSPPQAARLFSSSFQSQLLSLMAASSGEHSAGPINLWHFVKSSSTILFLVSTILVFGSLLVSQKGIEYSPQTDCIRSNHQLLSRSRCSSQLESPLIGARKWSKLEEGEIPYGRKGWEHVVTVLQNWNNGSFHLDGQFSLDRRKRAVPAEESVRLGPGFSWTNWVTNPSDDQPVRFVQHGPPSDVLLPRCDIDVHKYSSEGSLEDGVAMCVIARDEGRYLEEWFHYYYYLGVRKIVLYDHGSTDETSTIARRYAPFVEYLDWGGSVRSSYTGAIQVQAYQDCYRKLAKAGVRWVGFFDVDELLVFTEDPSQTLDSFLLEVSQKGGDKRVGSVAFNWFWMTSHSVALPDPAFQAFDMPYTFEEDGGDEQHHVKVFVRVEATSEEQITLAHFAHLNPGWGQFDAAGNEMAIGPWSQKGVFSPARINHYRTRSLQDWTMKVNKRANGRRGNDGDVYGDISSLEHLKGALKQPNREDFSILRNLIARQGCL